MRNVFIVKIIQVHGSESIMANMFISTGSESIMSNMFISTGSESIMAMLYSYQYTCSETNVYIAISYT